MAMDLIALNAAKKYVDETLTGAGALKGEKGDPGADGKDGYIPIRGTDYWTDADIAEIQSYIDNQIGGALNGSY